MAIEFKHATLPNGLQIIAEVDPTAHTAAAGIFVKAGARDEQSSLMGVSHFLEHMIFKGTDTRSAEQVDLDFDRVGALHNAFTTHEMTAFWAHVLPEHLTTATEVLADILRPALRTEDFNAERGVILEEIAMYDDQPFWVLYERAMEEYYGAHTMRHRVLGTPDTINAMTRDQMQGYFTHWYSADNAVLALAGKLDFDAMVELAAKHCGDWNTSGVGRAHETPQPADTTFTMTSPHVHQQYCIMISPGPAMEDSRRHAAKLLASILGDADGSRLYWALVDPGLAEEAQLSIHLRDGFGEFIGYFSCPPEDAEKVLSIYDEQYRLLPDSLEDDDLARQRAKAATAATLHGERPSGRMQRIGALWTYTGEYRPLEEDLAQINAVTKADVLGVLEAFPPKPRTVGHMRPEGA